MAERPGLHSRLNQSLDPLFLVHLKAAKKPPLSKIHIFTISLLTSASSKDERRRDKALKKICDKASSHSAKSKDGIHPSGTEIPVERPSPMTPGQMSLQDYPVTIPTLGLWEPIENAFSAPRVDCPVVSESLVSPAPPSPHVSRESVSSQVPVCQYILPEQFQHMIIASIQRTLTAGLLPPNRDNSVRFCTSASPDRDYQEDSLSIRVPDSPTASHCSHTYFFEEIESRRPSDDKSLPPEQSAFNGLFPLALFKSLLFKAVNTAQIGSVTPETVLPPSQGTLNPLFVELIRSVDTVPAPPLFLDVIRKQRSCPGSALVPSSTD